MPRTIIINGMTHCHAQFGGVSKSQSIRLRRASKNHVNPMMREKLLEHQLSERKIVFPCASKHANSHVSLGKIAHLNAISAPTEAAKRHTGISFHPKTALNDMLSRFHVCRDELTDSGDRLIEDNWKSAFFDVVQVGPGQKRVSHGTGNDEIADSQDAGFCVFHYFDSTAILVQMYTFRLYRDSTKR